MVTWRGIGIGDSIRVPGTVNGEAAPLVLDSGANRTLIRSDVIGRTGLPEIVDGLSDVTGRRTPLYGPVEVALGVNGKEYRQMVFVADHLSDPVILGLDFLHDNHCTLDLNKGALHINGQEVLFEAAPGGPLSNRSPKALRVRVMEPVTVEPNTERLVQCRLVGEPPENPVLLESGPLSRSGLVIGRGIFDPKARSVPVVVANVTDQPVRVRAGRMLGECEDVEIPQTQGGRSGQSGALSEPVWDLLQRSSQGLDGEQTAQVSDLLENFQDVFSAGDHDLGQTSLVEHTIDTGDSRPVKVPPRRIPIHKRQEAEETVAKLEQQGLIEPSTSPWSSALVFVKKKDGSLRCCVDYRLLNAVTKKDSYPLPRIDATLDALSGSAWFSTLDLKSGYHQIRLAEADRPKSAFSSGTGLWQWRAMPFGLCNAPATFERLMEAVLSGMHWCSILVYLDDVIVFGKTFDEKLSRLTEVLSRMRGADLKLNPKKCSLFRREVTFLGHVVSSEGVKTDPDKTKAVTEWPTPSNVKELRSFLGLCSYYRRFVKSYATIAAPLHSLTKAHQPFEWSQTCKDAFAKLKAALSDAPVLQYPDPNQTFILDTDASGCGIGAVLSQSSGGAERVVAYYSRALSGPERNYCATRRELLAVVEAVRHFHPYLYGAEFTVRSDHSALQWLRNLRDPECQLAHWLERLGQYNYEIIHRAGEKHGNADALSRRPCGNDCRYCGRRELIASSQCRVTTVMPLSGDTQDIQIAQRADQDIAPIIKCMEESSQKPSWEDVSAWSPVSKRYWEQWEQLRLAGGVLQRRWESGNGLDRSWIFVVPRSQRKSLLSETHGSVTSGHFGVKKTLERLRKRFYWVGMRRDVSEWCRVCEICMAKKGPQRIPQGPLQVVKVGAPMERVAVDVAGPFPVSSSGNRYIVVVIDYFTKWPEAFALPNQEASTIARALIDGFFSRFGVPLELHSDQGRNFESNLLRECCELLGIRKTRTTPLHPESDGMVERFNRTLVQELAKRCRHGQTEWDQHIPTILMAYRSAEHESTGYTPAELMLGRDLRLPTDMIIQRPPDDLEGPVTTTEFARSLRDRMMDVRTRVCENLKVSADSMKQRKDAKASLKPLEENDHVWLHSPQRKKGLSPKLMSPWDGPYVILKRLSAVTYRIQKHPRGKPKVVHFNRLWKMKGLPEFSWVRGSTDAEEQNACDGGLASEIVPSPIEVVTGTSGTPCTSPGDGLDGIGPASSATGGGNISPSRTGSSVGPRRSWRRRRPPEYLSYP